MCYRGRVLFYVPDKNKVNFIVETLIKWVELKGNVENFSSLNLVGILVNPQIPRNDKCTNIM